MVHTTYLRFLSCLILLTFSSPAADPFCFISIQKAGTHMLKPVLRILTGNNATLRLGPNYKYLYDIPLKHLRNIVKRTRQFLLSHTRYSSAAADILRETGHKVVLLIRDPRDQIVSLARYIQEKKHRLYKLTKNETLEGIITELIAGGPHNYLEHDMSFPVANIWELYAWRLDWLQYENTLLVRFEDLVGPKGDGDEEAQIRTLQQIADFLHAELTEKKRNRILSRIYGHSSTFRKGSKIGRWKDYFTSEHKRLFKEVAGNLLIGLGYEHDSNW